MKFRKPAEEVIRSVHVERTSMGDRSYIKFDDLTVIEKFLDSLPDEFEILGPGEVAVKWPKELTRERLKKFAEDWNAASQCFRSDALFALAAIAPERKKRMAEMWLHVSGQKTWKYDDDNWHLNPTGWRKVAGPIEIDD